MQLLLSVLQLVDGVSPLTSARLTGRTSTFTLETGNIPTKPTKSNFTAVFFFFKYMHMSKCMNGNFHDFLTHTTGDGCELRVLLGLGFISIT